MAKSLIKSSLIGAGIGLIFGVIMTFVFNFIALGTKDPDTLVPLLAHAARFTGAAACGLSASRLNRERGLITGLTAGGIYSAVILLVSAFVSGEFGGISPFICLLISVLISALFGLIGIPKEKSMNARRRALMKRSGL